MAILNFMLTLPGKKKKLTHFPEKIWQSFNDEFVIEKFDGFDPDSVYDFSQDAVDMAPKKHTIRRDCNNRWKAGTMIDFYINARRKTAFKFAPRVPVKSLQTISFSWIDKPAGYHVFGTPVDRVCVIHIDGKTFGDAYFYQGKLFSQTERIHDLATNDGFDSLEDFFEWFHEDFSGKIIHWTDLKY